ncbi:MAG: phosphatidate cytidylyltransferase [Sphingomonadaceae bacterium]|nr:phosphatidate cytidylyltransferase [Sphingomonadaceae bacterium]
MAAPEAAPRTPGGLLTRVVVGVALAGVAIAAVWAGGVAFTALVATACLLMSAEWSVMHGVARGFRLASLVALAFVAGVTVYVSALDALIVLAANAAVIGLFMRGFDRRRAFWVVAGLLYCGLPMVALLWMRQQPGGQEWVIYVFAVVWATDIGAFFVGRAIGGARFAPAISPNKTWAGVCGGIAAAAVIGTAVVLTYGLSRTSGSLGDYEGFEFVAVAAGLIAAFLGIVAIGGDLLESWLKRRVGVKDSGNLLPGHGGVMDRIDGLVPVAIVAPLMVALTGWAFNR